MSFGLRFHHPFREAIPQPVSNAYLYPITLDGWGYLIDRKPGSFVRRQVDLLKTQPADPTNPQNNLLISPEVWRRVAESWHMGAGQLMADRGDSLGYRFHDSMGIDCWNKWTISLLPGTFLVQAATTGKIMLEVVGANLVVAENNALKWYTSLGGAGTGQLLTGNALSMTADGEGVIIAQSDGKIVKCRTSTTQQVLGVLPNVNFVYYVKDRLLAAANNVLYDITSVTDAGNVIQAPARIPDPLVYTHPLASFRWIDATDGLACVFALGGVGDRWVVHRLVIKEDATGLGPPIVAAPLQDGEIGAAIESYMGYVFVGSSHGLRFGVPDGANNLSFGPLIRTKGTVSCFEGQERFVWYGNPNPDASHTGLGRLDLSTFTQPLTPAYANDLMTSGQGAVSSVVTFADKRVFAVIGNGVYAQDTKVTADGWLSQGQFSFGVIDKKVGLYTQLRFNQPLIGRINEDLQYDDPTKWNQVAQFVAGGPFATSENIYLQGIQFIKVEPRYRLYATEDRLSGPVVSRWELRAVAVAGRSSEWVVPLLLADALELQNSIQARDVQADLDRLLALVESSRVFVYREGVRAYQVNALDYEWKPERQSERVGYAWQGVFNIRIRETR